MFGTVFSDRIEEFPEKIFVPGETNRKNGPDGRRKKIGEFGVHSTKSSYRTKKIQKQCNIVNSNDGLTTSSFDRDSCNKCSVTNFSSNITKTTNEPNLQSDYIEKLHIKNICNTDSSLNFSYFC